MLSRTQRRRQQGFSLVELSIVLVILGLLVGGILAGQSLIRAAELRAVTSENTRYVTAISAFRDKYFGVPGDFNKASDFNWGALNGNGNGMIEGNATAGQNEPSTFWIHLTSAGLVEGSYTNVSNAAAWTLGTNNPRSKLGTAGWNAQWLGSVLAASTDHFAGSYGNAFFFGTNTGGATPTLTLPGGALKAEEAWNIDTKMDDGKPDQGSILSLETQNVATTGCSATASSVTTYNLANATSTACSLIVKSGY